MELVSLLGRGAVALWPTRGVAAGGGRRPLARTWWASAPARSPPSAALRRSSIAGAPAVAERVAADPVAGAPRGRGGCTRSRSTSWWTAWWRSGYERVDQVEERGDLSVRGGILDVYPSTADLPARIELFGDEIESMRAFSPFTQRTIRPISRLLAWPAAEQPGETLDPLSEPAMGDAVVVRLAPDRAPRRVARGAGAARGRGRGRRPLGPRRGGGRALGPGGARPDPALGRGRRALRCHRGAIRDPLALGGRGRALASRARRAAGGAGLLAPRRHVAGDGPDGAGEGRGGRAGRPARAGHRSPRR